MPLFVLQHHHLPDHCPAADPAAAAGLLKHLSSESAAGYGITVHGHAVIDGQHAMYVIADAPDRATMDRFAEPFARAGSVEVLPASACEAVVARGGCAVA